MSGATAASNPRSEQTEYARQILEPLKLPTSAIVEIGRVVEQRGFQQFFTEAIKLGASRRALAISMAHQMELAFYPSNKAPISPTKIGEDKSEPPKVVDVCERWLIARNRILYVVNPLDEATYSDAQAKYGAEIRNLGLIDYETLLALCESHEAEKPNQKGPRHAADPADDTRIDQRIDDWIRRAARENASDIHIKPHDHEVVIRLRLDGESRQIDSLPFGPGRRSKEYEAISNRILSRAGGDPGYYREVFDGAFIFEGLQGRTIKIRVAGIPRALTNSKEPVHKYTLRLLGNRVEPLQLEELGMPDGDENPQLRKLRLLGENRHGMALVTGPTGSGKTTTLSALLQTLRTAYPNKEIYTLEDPVEIFIPGVNHCQINEKMPWPKALQNILRQDPDVLLIGEIRELEVAEKAVEASQTGHLVLASLHTNSAIGSIARLRDMGLEAFNIAEILRGVTAQRLAKKVCRSCGQRAKWGELTSGAHAAYKAVERHSMRMHYMHVAENYWDLANLPSEEDEVLIPSLEGCSACKNTGYKGRAIVSELFEMHPILEEMIVNGEAASRLQAVAREYFGFLEMWEHAMTLIKEQALTFDHAVDALGPRPSAIQRPSRQMMERYGAKQMLTGDEV